MPLDRPSEVGLPSFAVPPLTPLALTPLALTPLVVALLVVALQWPFQEVQCRHLQLGDLGAAVQIPDRGFVRLDCLAELVRNR